MKKIRISAVTAGIIIATVAVAAQVIFGFSHPEAYGVCLVCHGRDMLAQLYQTVFHKAMDMSVSARSGPVLTVIGILAGAFIGAVSSGEFRWQWVEGKLRFLSSRHSRGHLRPYNFRLPNAADDTLRIRRRKGAAGRHSPHAGLRGRHSHTQEAQPQKGLST